MNAIQSTRKTVLAAIAALSMLAAGAVSTAIYNRRAPAAEVDRYVSRMAGRLKLSEQQAGEVRSIFEANMKVLQRSARRPEEIVEIRNAINSSLKRVLSEEQMREYAKMLAEQRLSRRPRGMAAATRPGPQRVG